MLCVCVVRCVLCVVCVVFAFFAINFCVVCSVYARRVCTCLFLCFRAFEQPDFCKSQISSLPFPFPFLT